MSQCVFCTSSHEDALAHTIPTVAYSADSFSGSKSAHIFTVNVGYFNTPDVASGTSYAGELFIGTADDSGNPTYSGHRFTTRPDKISFRYKYAPQGSEKFYVKIELKDAAGSVLYSKEDTQGPEAKEWTEYTTSIDWADLTKKPENILIIFKSSSSAKPKVSAKSNLEVAGKTERGHFGSSLYIDDIQMIYE